MSIPKFLIKNEQEYVALFKDFDLTEAEKFLNVEFAYEDGTYQSDFTFDGSNPDNEDQDVDFSTYRKNDDSVFPEQYPCLVLLCNEKDWDRVGFLRLEILDFVYLEDFNK